MVYYYLSDDPAQTRRVLQSLKDLGITRAHALVYWWQAETLGGDYWKKDYPPNLMEKGYYRALDNFVSISHELGISPSFRLGSNREWSGLWHPADPSGSVDTYARWVPTLAERYQGKIDHYVIGDEENQRFSAKDYYQQMFLPLAKAVRKGDPTARISSCATSSSPAKEWNLELIAQGLPQYADGIACNFWHVQLDDLNELTDLMSRVRAVWPAARFYGNGMVYAQNTSPGDLQQAAIVAQCMFNLWEVGWDSAPYYLYNYSVTSDTKQNYGIANLPDASRPLEPSVAWRSFQTIAHVFDDREKVRSSSVLATARPATSVGVEDGSEIHLAPPAPKLRVFEKGDELIIYAAYPGLRSPRQGMLNITLSSTKWQDPQVISMSDYAHRDALAGHRNKAEYVIENVRISLLPSVIVLKKVPE